MFGSGPRSIGEHDRCQCGLCKVQPFRNFGLFSIFICISFALREAAGPNSEFSVVQRCFFATLTLSFLTLFRLAMGCARSPNASRNQGLDNCRISFGKHKGKTYGDVYDKEKGYVN